MVQSFPSRMKSVALTAASFAAFALPIAAFATAAVTPATGGSALLSTQVGGTFTTLTGPVITEGATGDIHTGTITLNAPTGFQFNTSSAVTVAVTFTGPGTCSGGQHPVQLSSSTAVTSTSSITITVTATSTSSSNCKSILTYSGIQVRPTSATTLNSGNITKSGTATVTGVSGSTNFGTLTEIGVVTVTAATGGSSVSSSTVSAGSATALTGPSIAEGVVGEIGLGTIVLNAPSGFKFDTTSNVTASVSNNSDLFCFLFGSNVTLQLNSSSSQTVTPTASSITVTVSRKSANASSCEGTITFSGIKVRPTAASPLASGNITESGTSSYTGDNTNYGTLTETSSIATTTTTVVTSGSPSTYGDAVKFTATISGGSSPTGTITFLDGVSSIGTATVGHDSGSLTISTLSATTHSITASYAGDSNNTASVSSAISQLVNAKALTITANSTSKTYGDTVTFLGTEFNASGLVLSDAVASVTLTSTGAVANADVGAAPIVPSLAVGTGLSNYAITYQNGTLSIGTLALTVTATGASKTYDGTSAADVTLKSNALAGDDLTVTYTDAEFTDKNAANGKTINVTGISISGSDAPNYALQNTTATATADIGKRTLTASVNASDKTYDQTTDASVTLSDDRVAGDDVAIDFSDAQFSDKDAAAGKTVTVTGIAITGGADQDNYTLASSTETGTADINKKDLTITVTASDKVYDGDDSAGVNLDDDRIAGDTFTTTSDPATFSDKNADTGKTVTVSNLAISGGDSGDYSLTSTTATTTADITVRTLTVTASGSSKVYDTNTTASVTLSDDRVSGDDLTVDYSDAEFADANVGTAKSISVTGIAITGGADENNYTLSGVTTASATADITSAASATSTVLDAPTTSVVGSGVVLAATVTGANPTGTVDFYSGSDVIGSATIDASGSGSITYVFTHAGDYSLTADYTGDSNHLTSSSSTITIHVVDKADAKTVTTVGVSNPSIVGQLVVLTATVTGSYNPTGTVDFYSGSVLLGTGSLAGTTASLSNTFTLVGKYSITAHYEGDENNNPSSSDPLVEQILSQEVDKATPNSVTTLGVDNPTTVGSGVVLTATVSGAYLPTGIVDFYSGSVLLGSATLSGSTAVLDHTFTVAGSYSVTAHYEGDDQNNPSTSGIEVVLAEDVNKATPSTSTVLAVASTSTIGDNVTLTATVDGGYLPAGDVVFKDSGSVLTTVTLSGNTATYTTNAFAVGNHYLTAEYQGDFNNLGSTSPSATLQVVQKMTSSSLFSSFPSPNYVHTQHLLTVTVSGYNPTGIVSFYDNGNLMGTGAIIAGNAQFLTYLTLGSHTLSATYAGDINNFPSTSNDLAMQILEESSADNGGTGEGGASRGQGVTNANSLALFTGHNHGYGSTPPGAFGGGDVPLTQQEIGYICAMQGITHGMTDDALLTIATTMAGIMGRDPSYIVTQLQNAALCANTVSKGHGVYTASLLSVPVDGSGIPVSKNLTWNACIRGNPTLDEIRNNPDHYTYRRTGLTVPKSCASYHTADSWYFPDLGIYITFDRATRQLILPDGYMATRVNENVAEKQ